MALSHVISSLAGTTGVSGEDQMEVPVEGWHHAFGWTRLRVPEGHRRG